MIVPRAIFTQPLVSTVLPARRTVNRYLPWLFNPPGNTATQGPREFLDCVAHIRLLSWMLLGAVNHTLKFGYSDSVACMPIPLEASCHIADHVQARIFNSALLCKLYLLNTLCQAICSIECETLAHTRSFSGDLGRVRRAVKDVRGAHVLALSCLHPLPTVDSVPRADHRSSAGQGRAAGARIQHTPRLLGKGSFMISYFEVDDHFIDINFRSLRVSFSLSPTQKCWQRW